MYKAEILADSLSPQGDRLTTMKITFPRFILAEFNTHRMFSRNSASSRAIPFKKMVQMVEENPFIPIAWQKDHKGMQGTEYLIHPLEIREAEQMWRRSLDYALVTSKDVYRADVTKQLCNRLLEPFMWHTVIVSATEWANFFELRCPQYLDSGGNVWKSKKDYCEYVIDESWRTNLQWLNINKSQADIHIQAIAELMWNAYNESTPKKLEADEYHIPFGDNIDLSHSSFDKFKYKNRSLTEEELINLQVKVSVARCARISYQTLGDNPKIDYEADLRLHDMLAKSGHWSPFEHIAKAMSDEEYKYFVNGDTANMNWNTITGWCRNFRGFIQYRHLIENN